MESKLKLISAKAKEDKRLKFTALVHHVNKENLIECYKELKKNRACGIDEVTVEEYGKNLEENIDNLLHRLKDKSYRANAVRRVEIPKANSKEKRGLGIPTVEDKLVQLVVKKLLEAIYEQDFLECSYGFRPNLSCHAAIKALDTVVMKKPINYVVEVDIRKFYDNINHYWLQRCLEERILDKNFIWLIRRLLKAGVIKDGVVSTSDQGTSQGSVASPILANIYLHYVLDLWFGKVVKPKAKGYVELIRYCDDFVVCCESQKDAEEFLSLLHDRLKSFGLAISEEKTRIVKFGRRPWQLASKNKEKLETFNFLGFTHYCGKSRQGYFIMGHKTIKSSFARKLKETQEWLKAIRSQAVLKDWWPILKSKLTGHYFLQL
ncbi:MULTISPECIES: group II intron reverse transcriptase/maturase [unclassified Rickettsia]|uniref:group II intron reverse transcriptase/maturase n=1 Tax=unclassified Rickettsia TaxID=114295 RepID=UPI0031330589